MKNTLVSSCISRIPAAHASNLGVRVLIGAIIGFIVGAVVFVTYAIGLSEYLDFTEFQNPRNTIDRLGFAVFIFHMLFPFTSIHLNTSGTTSIDILILLCLSSYIILGIGVSIFWKFRYSLLWGLGLHGAMAASIFGFCYYVDKFRIHEIIGFE